MKRNKLLEERIDPRVAKAYGDAIEDVVHRHNVEFAEGEPVIGIAVAGSQRDDGDDDVVMRVEVSWPVDATGSRNVATGSTPDELASDFLQKLNE